MKWFRSNIKHGARLALVALALQFVLSFGHFHAVAAQAVQPDTAPFELSHANALTAPDTVGVNEQKSRSGDDPHQRSNDPCAICAVISLASSALFATPPLLELPQAIEFLYLTIDAEFIHLHSARLAFQPRAPPAS
jgi:hypothetical protein